MSKDIKNAVLVTGSSGYIGGNLCEMLYQCGYNIIAVDKKEFVRPKEWQNTSHNHDNQWKNFKVDLTLRSEVESLISTLQHNGVTVSFIINLAGETSIPNSLVNPVYTVGTNLLITCNVMFMVSKLNPQRFINANSCTYRCDDQDWNAYSWSKFAGRKIIQSSTLFSDSVFIDMIITNPIGSLPYYTHQKQQGLEYNILQSIKTGCSLSISTKQDGVRDETYQRCFISIYELLGAFMYAMTYNITTDTKVYCGVVHQNRFKQYPVVEFCEYCAFKHGFDVVYKSADHTGFTSIKEIDSPLIPEAEIMNYYIDNIPAEVFVFKDKIKGLGVVYDLLQDRENITNNHVRYELLSNVLAVNI